MKVILSDPFKQKLSDLVKDFDSESSESSRTHKIVARVLNEIEDETKRAIYYEGQEMDASGNVPDFILMQKQSETPVFFIIEAKKNMTLAKHKDQLMKYLATAKISQGCLTDGISWEMLTYDNGHLVREKNILISEPQAIVDHIISKL